MSLPKPKDRAEDAKPRLGRGLAALLGESVASGVDDAPRNAGDQKLVAIEFLRPNPRNPRRYFDHEDLNDLAESIRAKGIIQPIVVRPIANVAGSYEIIAGERRWRAAQAAQLHDVPVVVIEVDDREALAFAIIENVQRADLNAMEEARGYERLSAEFGYSQSELSRIIGKSRSHVANTLRLLKLPDVVVSMVETGSLSAGHARSLLSFPDPAPLALRIVEQGLTVRDVEQLAQQKQSEAQPEAATAKPGRAREKSELSLRIAKAFSSALGGLNVVHKAKTDQAGELRIRYSSPEELELLRKRLGADHEG